MAAWLNELENLMAGLTAKLGSPQRALRVVARDRPRLLWEFCRAVPNAVRQRWPAKQREKKSDEPDEFEQRLNARINIALARPWRYQPYEAPSAAAVHPLIAAAERLAEAARSKVACKPLPRWAVVAAMMRAMSRR